jgi:hypothetical protein
MEILKVSAKEFENIIPHPYHVFGQGAFAELNRDKADSIYYLLFKDGKYRLGLTAGVRNNSLYSPFSAPFGGFVFLSDDVKIGYIDNAVRLLKEWANDKYLTSLNLTLPPSIYHESFIAKQSNALFRYGFEINNVDLNYAFNLDNFNENYISRIRKNARKNLKIAFSNYMFFKQCFSNEEKKLAYDIISLNRKLRGFPLRMSWIQVKKTIKLIPADFFLVINVDQLAISSAVAFHVSPGKVQITYWGDNPEFSNLKTMNFLAYKIFEFYKKHNFTIVDIGPSTENSVPNFGLCEFKESIGCDISAKLNFSLYL